MPRSDLSRLSRREFATVASRAVAGLAATGAVGAGALAAAEQPGKPDILNHQPSMRYRRLGKTNLMLSEISLGGHWRNRENERYWGSFPDDKVPPDVMMNREEVVGRAIDVGVNYVDITTPAEATAYGAVLKSLGQRMYVGYSDYILCIRNPANRTPERIMLEIDEGLRRLQLECMDIFRPQALMDGKHTDEEIETVVKVFEKARGQGKVRFLGLSSHDRPFLMHLMEKFPGFSMFIFPFMAISEEDTQHGIFPLARQKDVGMVTIKPFAGGSLFRGEQRARGEDYDENEVASIALRRILANEYLTATVPGMTTISELENNVRVRLQPKRLTDREQEMLGWMGQQTLARLPADYQWLRAWRVV